MLSILSSSILILLNSSSQAFFAFSFVSSKESFPISLSKFIFACSRLIKDDATFTFTTSPFLVLKPMIAPTCFPSLF